MVYEDLEPSGRDIFYDRLGHIRRIQANSRLIQLRQDGSYDPSGLEFQ